MVWNYTQKRCFGEIKNAALMIQKKRKDGKDKGKIFFTLFSPVVDLQRVVFVDLYYEHID